MVSAFRTIGLAALFAATAGAEGAEVSPSGSYQAEALGRLELRTDGERLSGLVLEGGACGFEPRRRVLEGEWEGDVLVGRLTLCLKGPSCPAEAPVPVLVFYNREDHSLTTRVWLGSGCQSPALKGPVLVFQPVAEKAAAPARKAVASGAQRATPRQAEAAREALEQGTRLLAQKDWGGAVTWFERSISHDDRNWVPFFSLGTAHLMGGRAREAVTALERARALNDNEPSIPYHLACAYSRLRNKSSALESLREAVRLGFAIPNGASLDTELDRFLGSEGEYLGLANRAMQNYKAAAGRRHQSEP
jgi:hypothetical protein